jgi:hypothetical protein
MHKYPLFDASLCCSDRMGSFAQCLRMPFSVHQPPRRRRPEPTERPQSSAKLRRRPQRIPKRDPRRLARSGLPVLSLSTRCSLIHPIFPCSYRPPATSISFLPKPVGGDKRNEARSDERRDLDDVLRESPSRCSPSRRAAPTYATIATDSSISDVAQTGPFRQKVVGDRRHLK